MGELCGGSIASVVHTSGAFVNSKHGVSLGLNCMILVLGPEAIESAMHFTKSSYLGEGRK